VGRHEIEYLIDRGISQTPRGTYTEWICETLREKSKNVVEGRGLFLDGGGFRIGKWFGMKKFPGSGMKNRRGSRRGVALAFVHGSVGKAAEEGATLWRRLPRNLGKERRSGGRI